MSNTYPSTFLCDFYKISHVNLYPEGMERIYSTWTPRTTRIEGINGVVMFGLQYFIKEYLVHYFNEEFFDREILDITEEYRLFIEHTLGIKDVDTSHLEALHELGYLPILIKALPEGTVAPIKTPMFTIENTVNGFYWFVGYLETLLSTEIWQKMTNATIAHRYRQILDKYALETGMTKADVDFQGHDFSMRGMANLHAAAGSGAGHLLSFSGTDTIPAIHFLEKYYGADVTKQLVGSSIPATEHSVMCAHGQDEVASWRDIITRAYPTGLVSIVADTWDFWGNIQNTLVELKDDIMKRDGKVVIRPDSGNPVTILCGEYFEEIKVGKWVKNLEDAKNEMANILIEKVREETPHGECGDSEPSMRFKFEDKYYEIELSVFWNRYDKQYYYIDEWDIADFEEFTPAPSQLGLIECLWNIFGGTVNEKGYKVLDQHIGAIYGDSITLDRADKILKRLKQKGFASTNVVLGIGSFTYQYNTRDTFGFAMKATWAKINGEEKFLFKDPKTDDGTKRSQRGRVAVTSGLNDELIWHDGMTLGEESQVAKVAGEYHVVYKDGSLYNEQTLEQIRYKLSLQ